MPKYFFILFLIIFSCKGKDEATNLAIELIKTSEYQLIKTPNSTGLLILFPCFPCDAENTLNELKIAEHSIENGFSVLAMNLNQRLYLEANEKKDLADLLFRIIDEHDLPGKNIFIGGFSSGGNVSLLLTDFLVKTDSKIQPKGVFVVDSPVDLLALYRTSEKNIERDYNSASITESKMILDLLNKKLGEPEVGKENYLLNSPYTSEMENIDNLTGLADLRIRFYTEPDIDWWRENRGEQWEDLNAFYIRKLSEKLRKEFNPENVELIETQKKGYKANGEKHPHSWSVVDIEDLFNWMAE